LAEHFITQICQENGIAKVNITPEAIGELQKINWTGNIREFRNVIERLIILCDKTITDKDVALYAKPIGGNIQ
jgi:DNA-binding NtrC family response regulator